MTKFGCLIDFLKKIHEWWNLWTFSYLKIPLAFLRDIVDWHNSILISFRTLYLFLWIMFCFTCLGSHPLPAHLILNWLVSSAWVSEEFYLSLKLVNQVCYTFKSFITYFLLDNSILWKYRFISSSKEILIVFYLWMSFFASFILRILS